MEPSWRRMWRRRERSRWEKGGRGGGGGGGRRRQKEEAAAVGGGDIRPVGGWAGGRVIFHCSTVLQWKITL